MTDREEAPGLDLATGSSEEPGEWVGKTNERQFAHEPVNGAMIRFYASMIEDGYPAYWNRRVANRHWNGVPSPPGMLTVWRRPLGWTPDSRVAEERELFARVPFPPEKDAILTVSVETTFERQILQGEWLNWQDRIVDVTEEKDTDLGRGHFVTSETTYRNQRGTRVATNTKTVFRYASETAASEPAETGGSGPERQAVDIEQPPNRAVERSRRVDDVEDGEAIPPFAFPVTYEKVIYDVAATRDFYPGHHDPAFARAQGNDSIFLNNIAFQGLVDRFALEWAGPAWRVVERRIDIRGAAPAGTRLQVTGEVTTTASDPGHERLGIDGRIENERQESICPFSITIRKDTG